MSATTSETSLQGIIDPAYVIKKLDIGETDGSGRYIAGYANVAGVRDNQGDVVTLEALQKAWEKWKTDPDFCILSFLHSNIPLAKVVFEEVIDSEGRVHQSGVDETGLYLVSQVRSGTKLADEMWHKIEQKKYRGYSIAGQNLNPQPRICEDGTCTTKIVDFDLYEVAIVDNPANKFSLFNVLKRDDLAKLSEVTNPIKNTVLRNGLVKISKKPCPEGGHYHVVINAKGELYNELSPLFEKEGMVIIEEERAGEEYVSLFNLALLRPYMGLTAEEQHGGFNSPLLKHEPKKEGETPLEKKEDVKEEKVEESPEPKSAETPKVEEKKAEPEVSVPPTPENLEAKFEARMVKLEQMIAGLVTAKAEKPAATVVLESAPVAEIQPEVKATVAEAIPVETPQEAKPVEVAPEAKPEPVKVEVKPEMPIESRGVRVPEEPITGIDLGTVHANVSWKDIQNQEPRII